MDCQTRIEFKSRFWDRSFQESIEHQKVYLEVESKASGKNFYSSKIHQSIPFS